MHIFYKGEKPSVRGVLMPHSVGCKMGYDPTRSQVSTTDNSS